MAEPQQRYYTVVIWLVLGFRRGCPADNLCWADGSMVWTIGRLGLRLDEHADVTRDGDPALRCQSPELAPGGLAHGEASEQLGSPPNT